MPGGRARMRVQYAKQDLPGHFPRQGEQVLVGGVRDSALGHQGPGFLGSAPGARSPGAPAAAARAASSWTLASAVFFRAP